MPSNKQTIMELLGLTEEDFHQKPTAERVKELEAELKEAHATIGDLRTQMESMRSEFLTRLSEVISKSGIKFDKGSLNNPYEWKPLLLVVKGLYYEHDGVVKLCIDGGVAKDFEGRFEAV